ncbi:hypothetical protein HJX17_09765 [Klebsiella pneumoniae]|nr:hypothetical protein HJX07_09855 [Klebsiella pneumoniae]QJM98023.1 hypothetical protein HJX17_09765 [Klebsiella pneumoniae]QJN36156.1 hypothetical protein HJX05_15610 [Klebsiella pneumoniae]
MFAGKKSAQIREILISESAWEEMTCLFAPSLDVGEKDVSLLVVIGATDTRKPVTQANIPDKQSISLTKQQIVNKYCAPFGYGNWYFDAFKQRGVKLHYYFYSAVDTPLFTFTVNKSDCD